MKKQKIFSLILMALFMFIGTGKSLSQQESDSSKKETDLEGLTGVSFQFQKIPDHWTIKYYGLAGEIVPKKRFSYSGSLVFGKGSNDKYFLHVPGIGFVIGIGLLSLSKWFEIEMKPSEFFLFFLLENFHYNIRVTENVRISPTLHLLGCDLGGGEGGKQGSLIITNGIGICIKVFLTESFMIGSGAYYNHFHISGDTNLDKGNHFGYTSMIYLGFIF
jgi:hypothetical protein